MDEDCWIMQGKIGWLRRNRNIALAKGKGLGAFTYVVGDFAICNYDIASGVTLRYAITISHWR